MTSIQDRQMEEFCLGNGRYSPNRLQDRSRYFPVYSDKRDGVGPALRFSAAERERSDIDSEFSESASNLADHAGLVAVAQIQNRPFELRLQWYAFDLEQAWRAV